jgi:DNA-binding Lrp family transcriptional regulator
LFYLSDLKIENFETLVKLVRKNILFENISDRNILERIRELKRDKFIHGLKINIENKKAIDCLAFLYWCRMKDKNYNALLNKKTIKIFRILFENGEQSFGSLVKETNFSKPTISKYLKILEDSKFVSTKSKKIIKPNLNDLSFFYINFLDLSTKSFELKFSCYKFKNIKSKKVEQTLIKLHVYSTTVTEGNTATERDVENIFRDYPTELTPREITEILNAKKAILEVYKIHKKEINIEKIKDIHKILMNNLIENPGEFYYGRKRVVGFKTKFPISKEQIYFALTALLHFYSKNMDPVIKSTICHFIFVSIHPFIDGNGRIARLLHSWILLKENQPLFAFSPDKKYRYFELLEKARNESLEEFIEFCISEHYNILKKENIIQ